MSEDQRSRQIRTICWCGEWRQHEHGPGAPPSTAGVHVRISDATIVVAHSHCPDGCIHPQPFITARRETPDQLIEICGRCWVRFGVVTEMIPCTPKTC